MTTPEQDPRIRLAEDASPLRFVTAASLFDGHDAAIHIMRRMIQDRGAEVIHLGHNRGVDEIVRAAVQEDADAIAVSSYQGGHIEFFRYMIDRLAEEGREDVLVFGGGGGTITPEEIAELEAYGVERIYHPDDGLKMGLPAMIDDVVERAHAKRRPAAAEPRFRARMAADPGGDIELSGLLSAIERGALDEAELRRLRKEWRLAGAGVPVVGLTGTGGAGKSSVADELLNRFLDSMPEAASEMRIALLAVDPTRRRTGGALLGDRIRMNSLRSDRAFMRSMATRRQHRATSEVLGDAIALLKASGFSMVLVETAGIGQSDSEIVDLVDLSIYVMTSDYGAASQLEKIDMLDFADVIVLNKFDRRGGRDALRDIRKQWRRNRLAFQTADEDVPVYPTIASQFQDPGVNWMFWNVCRLLQERLDLDEEAWTPEIALDEREPSAAALIPDSRSRYLAEIAEASRAAEAEAERRAAAASRAHACYRALAELDDPELPEPLAAYAESALETARGAGAESPAGAGGETGTGAAARAATPDVARAAAPSGTAPAAALGTTADETLLRLRRSYQQALAEVGAGAAALLRAWPARAAAARADRYSYPVRGREVTGDNYVTTLSHLRMPKLALPEYSDWGDLLRFLLKHNLPGAWPYTAGVYPYRRRGEEPTRMFAGEGIAERTNRRFHFVSRGQPANRLSTAFDSVTLYGSDPGERPDIWGKVGNSGVSIATVDDMKRLYSGFDLCDPATSVSMTINGPAPTILAFFMNAAIDQQVELHLRETGGLERARAEIDRLSGGDVPVYRGELPEENDGLGLALLGISGDRVVEREVYERIRADALSRVRGTVQADILKEDQAQNTCIFSTEFSLRTMGDVQQFFIDENVRNYYSASVSGYHIAEAGANPITQLAFTLANGFTIVEYYLARGMAIDDFAPNLSFFFSNGMDPEYAVIGRVARRIWARAMRERYGASARSQMLKYHIQTSGRSLHAQEIQFNDIRTTLQALYGILDRCNSLHTNAFDEAITTPTEQSVRRALAIQLIINREFGLNRSENPWQGSFALDQLTDAVEEAVYLEFERLSERGGVLAAMDTMYQRSKIQDESMEYEAKKHDGSLPVVGVNTFLAEGQEHAETVEAELIRSTDEEKRQQIESLASFHRRHAGHSEACLERLQDVARRRGNVFEELMETVKHCSLGQISDALYRVGGEYRRSM